VGHHKQAQKEVDNILRLYGWPKMPVKRFQWKDDFSATGWLERFKKWSSSARQQCDRVGGCVAVLANF